MKTTLHILAAVALLVSCRTPPASTPLAKPMSPTVTQKLDPPLRALAEAVHSKDAGAVDRTAKDRNIPLERGLIRVQITADKVENVSALETLVTGSGGQVTTHLNVAIFALVPPVAIEKIAADSRVWNMTVPGIGASPVSH